MTGRRLVPCPWPRRCGDCAVFVSLCQGTAGGPCPQDLLCAAPKHRLASSSLVFMPLYKRQRICRMVFLYVPFKRPSFGFPLLPVLALQPRIPPWGCWGGGRQPGLRFAFAVVTKNVRVAFLFSPAAPFPGVREGRGQRGGSARAPPACAGALLHSGRVLGPHLLLCPQGCRSPSGSRPRCPLWSRCSVRVAGCEGTQRGQSGGQGVWGSGALCPQPLSSPGRETLGSWPCYFSITE